MKSIKKILTVFTSTCFILGSCDIDPTLTSSYPSDIIWSNESNLITYINGYYSLVGGYYGLGGEACTDMLKQNNPVSDYNQFVFGSMPITTTSNMFDTWGGSHSSQLSLTRFLENLEKNRTNFSDSIATLAEAKVRFFRGVTCFNLAKCYGGQYIIYRQLPVLGEKNHPLCSSQEGWDFIYEDLKFAAEHLPTKDKVELGCLSSGAAYGMLARAMLYAERWKEASDAAAQVMNQDYELYEDYGKLFTNSRLVPVENKESVIEFGYLKDKFTYSFDYFYCPPSDGGYAEISPTEDLVSSYQMADGSEFDWDNPEMAANPYEGREPRFYATILYNGCQWKGETLYTYEGSKDGFGLGGGTTSTGYYMRKLMKEAIQPKGTSFTGQGDLTYYYMRYAEVLLIYAEAMAMQDKLPEALDALNQVRRRAGFTKDLTAATQTEFMKLLRHERKIELAFEGHRFWDLRRWGLASTVLNGTSMHGVKPIKVGDNEFTYEVVDIDGGKTRVWEERYARFPIPLGEIEQNEAVQQFDEWK